MFTQSLCCNIMVMFFITAIGGVTGRLLEQNAQAMDQISANFRSFKVNLAYHLVSCISFTSILYILIIYFGYLFAVFSWFW